MTHIKYIVLLIFWFTIFNCKIAAKNYQEKPQNWYQIAIAEGVETHIDTIDISRDNKGIYGYEKRIFTTPESRRKYVNRIRNTYAKMGQPEKANKWRNFYYSVYYSLYDCTNKRFRILFVEDFDVKGNRIAKTVPAKGTERWIEITLNSIGDYTFFYVCDNNATHKEDAKMKEQLKRNTERKRQEIRIKHID